MVMEMFHSCSQYCSVSSVWPCPIRTKLVLCLLTSVGASLHWNTTESHRRGWVWRVGFILKRQTHHRHKAQHTSHRHATAGHGEPGRFSVHTVHVWLCRFATLVQQFSSRHFTVAKWWFVLHWQLTSYECKVEAILPTSLQLDRGFEADTGVQLWLKNTCV